MALASADLPDLPALRAAFDTLDFDRATLPVDFDRALIAFHRGLSEALVAEASRQDSPLFNRVNLGRMLTIQALLQQQGSTLATIVQRLQRIEGQGGAVYNVIIAQATGVAIGDGARVEQALPADVRATLDEVLRLVRDLSRDRRPPPYTADDVRRYLENVIESCQTLDLRGAGGPVDHLPQELVAALTDPSALRARASVRLLEALGTSPAASSAPGLRRQIVAALAAALHDPDSRRYVWVSAEESDGTLDQDLYRALLRVAGF